MDAKFWLKSFLAAYPNEIKERYKYLRSIGLFTVDQVIKTHGSIMDSYDLEWYEMDYYTWNQRPSIAQGNLMSKDYMKWWLGERIKYLDEKYEYNS